MKKAILKFLATMALFVACFMLQKVLFMLAYHKLMPEATILDRLSVIWHGLPMDLSVAGYLSVIPSLLLIAEIWVKGKSIKITQKAYYAVVALLLSIITCLDIELYGYWGFRLDMTPIFYFTTSPSAAMASVTWRQFLHGILAVATIAYGIYLAFDRTVCRISIEATKPTAATAVIALLTVALFIPIRGGVTVSTMNLSRSYFSHDKRLNHAAINPAFSLLYSATHQNSFGEEYNFMPTEEAEQQISLLNLLTTQPTPTDAGTDSSVAAPQLLTCDRPDIYLVILESFSAHLMPSLGGENIAVNLDSIARNGISFTNFYANSFRTDRALPSILSGFPAQPSMSLLKYVEKIEALPSIAAELKKEGYHTAYYYGGDINFANINAYLVSAGYDRIVCDKDFPLSQRTSKWGAHDHLLFQRALNDMLAEAQNQTAETPHFTVLQTSSSHEPFDVPFHSPEFAGHPQKNAFAYTDSCLRVFVDGLKQSPRYRRSLVVIVPDHLGAWPLELPDAASRHHVPLVLTGGAIAPDLPHCIDVPGAQTDIAATLLNLLGMDASAFPFSKNLLDTSAPHYAVFTEPSIIGIITPTDTLVYNCDARVTEQASGINATRLEMPCKAYLQTIYNAISGL